MNVKISRLFSVVSQFFIFGSDTMITTPFAVDSAALIAVGLLRTDLTGQKDLFFSYLSYKVSNIHENPEPKARKAERKILKIFLKRLLSK